MSWFTLCEESKDKRVDVEELIYELHDKYLNIKVKYNCYYQYRENVLWVHMSHNCDYFVSVYKLGYQQIEQPYLYVKDAYMRLKTLD